MAAWEMQVDSSLAFCQSRWPFVRDFGELRFMMDMFFSRVGAMKIRMGDSVVLSCGS